MRYLFEDFPTISYLVAARGAFVLLDYDGTLVEIAPTPELAVMDEARRDVLRQLSQSPNCHVAIVSGRDLDELKRMVGVDGLFYSGSHGLELEGPGISYRYNVAHEYVASLFRLTTEIEMLLSHIDGALIEKKKLSLCIHYRLCEPDQARMVRHIVAEVVTPLAISGDIRVLGGKKNVEILPPCDWNKGRIVTWLMEEYRKTFASDISMPIFLGDDATDETAFGALAGKGLTVLVGEPRESSAQYFVRDVGQVYEFFGHMIQWLECETE
jgi:trehalose-phosphatase